MELYELCLYEGAGSAPSRYDRGIRLITLGGVNKAYERLASRINDGWKMLDIGCGTGAMTLRAARCPCGRHRP